MEHMMHEEQLDSCSFMKEENANGALGSNLTVPK